MKTLKLLSGLADKKGIVVNVVDVFDFEGSFINAVKRIVGNKKIILAANKFDYCRNKLINVELKNG